MKITVHTSKSVKPPAYCSASDGDTPAAATTTSVVIPLTVFDEVTHDEYIPGIFFFHPPAPPADALEAGLAKMLVECREWAGRLVTDAGRGRGGKRAILLNDAGVRLVEASADVALRAAVAMSAPRVEPEVLELHPSCDDVTP